jgi:GT2 family glycosyltransferase
MRGSLQPREPYQDFYLVVNPKACGQTIIFRKAKVRGTDATWKYYRQNFVESGLAVEWSSRMLSILIVNWNTRDLLCACLASIQAHPPGEPYEVVVVDNDSTDGSAERVREDFPNVRLVLPKRNTGYAAGNNLAFEAAQGDLLLTLNPDTEFIDDSLQAAIDVLRDRPEVGCLGIRQVEPDGSTQHSVRGFPAVRGILGDLLNIGKMLPGTAYDGYRLTAFDYDIEQFAPQPMGTFLLFRKVALEKIGDPKKPFDEAFPIFFNEVDLLYRLFLAGYPCLYSPKARVLHHGGEGTKQVRKSMIWESHRSLVRFMRKHYLRWWNAPAFAGLTLVIYGAAFIRARGYHAGFRS